MSDLTHMREMIEDDDGVTELLEADTLEAREDVEKLGWALFFKRRELAEVAASWDRDLAALAEMREERLLPIFRDIENLERLLSNWHRAQFDKAEAENEARVAEEKRPLKLPISIKLKAVVLKSNGGKRKVKRSMADLLDWCTKNGQEDLIKETTTREVSDADAKKLIARVSDDGTPFDKNGTKIDGLEIIEPTRTFGVAE